LGGKYSYKPLLGFRDDRALGIGSSFQREGERRFEASLVRSGSGSNVRKAVASEWGTSGAKHAKGDVT